MVKKSIGRQRIEIVKIKNESHLQVTFSKRKSGVFKKASELCTLSGAHIVIIVFSPGRKVFSFGHPNVETVISRFLNNNPPPSHQHDNLQLSEAHRNSVIRDLNNQLTEVLNQLDLEKKKHAELEMMRERAKRPENWWENPIKGLTFGHLNTFNGALKSLRDVVTLETSKFFQANVHRHQNFYVGSSGNATFGIDGCDPSYMGMFGQRSL